MGLGPSPPNHSFTRLIDMQDMLVVLVVLYLLLCTLYLFYENIFSPLLTCEKN